MGLIGKRKRRSAAPPPVQTSAGVGRELSRFSGFSNLGLNAGVYRSLRENVPVIDAAVMKIVRLVNDFSFETGNERVDEAMNAFFEEIPVGGNQTGISAFAASYLSDLLTYGSACGEMIADDYGFYALNNGELCALEVRRAENGLDLEFYNSGKRLKRQELILFSALDPQPGQIMGTSLLRGLPFIGDVLLTIYNTIARNWEHAGNIRYAVTYNPRDGETDAQTARERAQQICSAWQDAMSSTDRVKDFVAVGDVSVKVIGADSNVLSSEIPVRQLLEQIVAKTGLPPYMLGFSWSTTERMSLQQADMLTTELEAYRKVLTPVLLKIARKYLELNSLCLSVRVKWEPITLQDETELARARLYDAQAQNLQKEGAEDED